MPTKHSILSGIQPSGKLHLGNYLGALKNFVELQKQYNCFFMIADYHAITQDYDPATKQQDIIELGREFLAAGIDPTQSTLFIQSYVPEHTELGWIFNCLTPIGHLERMTQYKDKASRQKHNINAGLFDYPVLQAADVLLYKPYGVPVGQDQDQHLELTRQITKFFNNRFGETFTEPQTIHTDVPKVMSLLEPEKKMSKSLGENHCIYISDEPEVIAKKLSRAVSDSGDAKTPGGKNLLELCKIFCDESIYKNYKKAAKEKSLRYGDLKKDIAQAIAEYFADFRTAKQKLSDKKVLEILKGGSLQAQSVASKTMTEVRKKIGVR